MRLFWTPEAIAQVQLLSSNAERFAPGSGLNLVADLMRRVEQLEAFPFSGRIVPEYNARLLRELIEDRYRILYEVFPDRIEIVTVLHGRQHLPRK